MKVELKDGTMIHLDSADELPQVLKIIGGDAKAERKPLDLEAQLADEGQRVRAFLRNINPNARKFMVSLIVYRNGVDGDSFAEATKFTTDKFGGIMGGIEKHATNQSLNREQFIISQQKIDGSRRYRFLKPGPMLLKYEIDLNKIIKQAGESEAISVGA